MVAVRFPDIISLESILEKMLSMRVFEWLVSLVGCRIYGITELENYRISRLMYIIIKQIDIEISKKKNLFLFFRNLLKHLVKMILNSKTSILGCL